MRLSSCAHDGRAVSGTWQGRPASEVCCVRGRRCWWPSGCSPAVVAIAAMTLLLSPADPPEVRPVEVEQRRERRQDAPPFDDDGGGGDD